MHRKDKLIRYLVKAAVRYGRFVRGSDARLIYGYEELHSLLPIVNSDSDSSLQMI